MWSDKILCIFIFLNLLRLTCQYLYFNILNISNILRSIMKMSYAHLRRICICSGRVFSQCQLYLVYIVKSSVFFFIFCLVVQSFIVIEILMAPTYYSLFLSSNPSVLFHMLWWSVIRLIHVYSCYIYQTLTFERKM